jgi:lysophospholipase L1-like esterase
VNFKSLIVFGLLSIYQLSAQEMIQFQGSSQSPDLICPGIKKSNTTPPQQPSDFEIVYSLPDDEEIEAMKKNKQDSSNQLQMQLTKQKNGGPYRVGLWGDSHSAANFITEELLKSIGLDTDSALPSFIPPSMGRPGVRLPIRKYCQGSGWQFNYSYTGVNAELYGPALLKLNTKIPNSYLWIDFRSKNNNTNQLKKLNVLFSKTTHASAKLGVQIDGRAEEIIDVNNLQASHLMIQGDSLFGVIKIRLIEGAISIDGFVPTYNIEPKLFMDTFGIPGATVKGWQSTQKSYIDSLKIPMNYDLIVLEYGTNEGNQAPFDSKAYKQMLRESLQNFRSIYPNASCILMGPTDRGIWYKKTYTKGKKKLVKTEQLPDFLKYSKIHQEITQIQKDVGNDFSCSSWSWQQAMGGLGGAYTWIKSNPPLMAKDLIHLTVQGYQETAKILSKDMDLSNLITTKEPNDWVIDDPSLPKNPPWRNK